MVICWYMLMSGLQNLKQGSEEFSRRFDGWKFYPKPWKSDKSFFWESERYVCIIYKG
jgi:hypothetical protein